MTNPGIVRAAQEQERDQQREDAERFGHGEPEDQVAELALRGGRIAQRGREILAEDDAHADAGATHADAGNAGTDVLRSGCEGCGGSGIHQRTPFFRSGRGLVRAGQWPGWIASLR
jgi:hypothetical protein